MLHSDNIAGDLASNIWRNNAHKISYIRKKGKWILLKGDGMVTEWHWMVTEWSLKCTCQSVDWMVTERWLNGAFQFSRNCDVSSCGDQLPLCKALGLIASDKKNVYFHKNSILSKMSRLQFTVKKSYDIYLGFNCTSL